jgi:hypothetical protein
MARKRGLTQIVPDLTNMLDRDFNGFIEFAVTKLADKDNSPVYTGFFASSWKAGTQRAVPKDKVEDFQPWSRLKERRDAGDVTAYRIAPRYRIPTFSHKTKVFIGNTTEYAAYALENPRVARFVQGTLGTMINNMFSDRRKPDIRVASEKGVGGLGFLAGKTYVSYEQM